MLLVTYGSHVVVDLIVFARLNIEDYWPSAVVAAALVGAITSAVWGVAYSIAALRKRQGIAPTRSAALRSVPFLPFKTGGIWVLAGLPLNAVIAFVPPIMAPEEDWTTYAWIGLHVGLILLFWSAVRRFERTPG